MYLRDVRLDDVDAYVQMRCDPEMMTHLGGPHPREQMAEKVARDVADVEAGAAVISMIVDDSDGAGVAATAGIVTLWPHEIDGVEVSEIGWMVLPDHQGRGLATRAVRAVLDRARAEGRWGVVHAYPSVDNAPSNGICRATGFTLQGAERVELEGTVFHSNHWWIDTTGPHVPSLTAGA